MGDGGGTKKVDLTYFLGSNDNLGNLITPIQLKGDNFDEWARVIRTSLMKKRKLGFVNGVIPKPFEAKKLEDWNTVHSMLVSWILNTIEPGLRSTLSFYTDAHALWNNLKERFSVVNGTRICQLKSAIGDCKQGKGEAVVDYFGRLSRLWDDLATYEVPHACSLGGNKCEVSMYVEKLQAENRLHGFLIGLNNSYGPLRSNLLSQDPLPNINRAYQHAI